MVRIGNPPTPGLSSLKGAQLCSAVFRCLLPPFPRFLLLRPLEVMRIHLYILVSDSSLDSSNLPSILSPALPLRSLLLITTAELGVVVVIAILVGVNVVRQGRGRNSGGRRRRRRTARRSDAAAAADVDEVAGVLAGVHVLLDEVAELLVARVDELRGCEAALVLDARVGTGLEHHVDEVVAKGALGGGFGVEPADGGVQGGVALLAVDGVAFEVGLVEEVVDDVVFLGSCFSIWVGFSFMNGGGEKGRFRGYIYMRHEGEAQTGLYAQLPREAASW